MARVELAGISTLLSNNINVKPVQMKNMKLSNAVRSRDEHEQG